MEVKKTEVFENWFLKLRDIKTKMIVSTHIRRMTIGNLGDVKNIGGNIFEKRIYYGAGYRLYFMNKSNQLIILLCGGDKSTQHKDIEKAKQIAKDV